MGNFAYGGDLSGQTDGKPILLGAGATTIHTATAGTGGWDEVHVEYANSHTSAVEISVNEGAVGALIISVPSKSGWVTLYAKDLPLNNGNAITVTPATVDVIQIKGYFNRYTA